MLKSAPRVMAIVLLVSIAVLMVIAGGTGFSELFKSVEANTKGGGNNNNVNNNNDTELPDDTEEPPVKPPVNSSNFPKAPAASTLFAYTQSIETDSALTLEAVHQTTLGIFLIISGAPKSGDFSSERQSVTVINMSEDGTLQKCLTLSASAATYYVCSQLTSEGLAVAVKTDDSCLIYTVDYTLAGSSVTELEAVISARIFPLDKGFMFLAERAGNTVYLMEGGAIRKSAAIQSGVVLGIIELGACFNVFINGINGYSVVFLDKGLSGFSQVTVPEKKALEILPVVENGTQKYLVVESSAGSVYISKHLSSFRESDCERVGMGLATGADIYQNGGSVFLLLKGANPRVYLVDMALNFALSSSTFYKDINEIFGCESYNGGYLMLVRGGTENNLSLIDIRNDGTVSTKNIALSANKAEFAKNADGTVSIIYTVSDSPNAVRIAAAAL